jgi:hypothetical protein
MSLYGTFSGSGSSSKMAAQNEPKTFDTTVVAAGDAEFGDGNKGDGVAGWLPPKFTCHFESIH